MRTSVVSGQWSVASGVMYWPNVAAILPAASAGRLATGSRQLATDSLQIVISVRRGGKHLVRSWSGYGVAVLVDLHAQAQPHRRQDFFNLVQRLASEVLGLQHLGFSLLNQFTDALNVRVLQAVVAANGKLKFFDRTVEVFVLDLRLARFARRRGFDLFLKVDEDVHVVLQQLRG